MARVAAASGFEFVRPGLNDLIRTLHDCHQLIWKKDKLGPTDAFYEFSKLIFVKLREDQKIVKMIEDDEQPNEWDFRFSTGWIEQQAAGGVSENPIALLFDNIREDLEEKIRTGDKKRIFAQDDRLALRTETIVKIVERLQHYDLHGIDEDLNGRMFETFLNAPVRGRELGQFFTPRSVVKYMTRTASLQFVGSNLPVVLDGCCGSGGFLIEAMATLAQSIDNRTDLTKQQRLSFKKTLYTEHLFGIDAAEKIARVARLNMYLHGDGGSTIFSADTLDKKLSSSGSSTEIKRELAELRDILLGPKGQRFDVILTNPPFSMEYSRKTQDEAAVLDQYQIAVTNGKPTTKEKSNVLFMERYCDLMKAGSELLTVIDNTVLNGSSAQRYRDFILDKFVIRQVISLPFNTFFAAQASVHTSILHLRKKEIGEEQGHVFMGILNNIGHNDHQRYTPERDNTQKLLELYKKWNETGIHVDFMTSNTEPDETLGCPFQVFVVKPEEVCRERLDAFYYSLELKRTRKAMRKNENDGKIRLMSGGELQIIPTLTPNAVREMKGNSYRYFDIGDVTKDGEIVRSRTDLFEKLPTRARLQVQGGDVVFARNNSSRGTAVIIPGDYDGQLVTTGFLAVRPANPDDALLLWAAFTSEAFRKQIYYLAITAVQPEVRRDIFQKDMLIPFPVGQQRERLLSRARSVRELQHEKHKALKSVRETANRVYTGL